MGKHHSIGFFNSTIGMKYMMGISGLIWSGFVLVHMLGNVLLFVGSDAYNSYSHMLTSGKMVYLIEAILIWSLVTHMVMGIKLSIKNKSARPLAYAVSPVKEKSATIASRTMIIHGPLLLFFIIYHLITFKFGSYYETTVDGVVMRDIFKLVVEVFSEPMYVLGYVICMILLGTHLSHGVSSAFQSFGLNHRAYENKIKCAGYLYATLVMGGFIAQPLYVFFFNR